MDLDGAEMTKKWVKIPILLFDEGKDLLKMCDPTDNTKCFGEGTTLEFFLQKSDTSKNTSNSSVTTKPAIQTGRL